MKNHKKLFFVRVLFILLLIFSIPIFANTKNDQLQNLVNQYVEKYSTTDASKQGEGISGIQLTILQNGKMVTFVAGTIGHDTKSLVTPENLFSWGSITKEFTTAIILQLQEQRKLNLNDTLQHWFPEKFISLKNKKSTWPKLWKKVRIFQLLNMTSGIPNAVNNSTLNSFWNKKRLFEKNWQPDQLIDVSANYERTQNCKHQCFKPGTHYSYSNTNYVIAGMIAEKAAKIPFSKQMHDFLKIEGVTAHYIPNKKPATELKNMMHGYYYDSQYGYPAIKGVSLGFDTSDTYAWSWTPASGALIGNTENMAKGVFKLFHGDIISNNLTSILKSNYYVNQKNGKRIANVKQCTIKNTGGNGCYGLGLMVLVYDKSIGLTWIYEGVVPGYRSVYIYSPKENTILCLSVNSTAGNNDNVVKFAKTIFNVLSK